MSSLMKHHDRERLIWDSGYGIPSKLLLLAINSCGAAPVELLARMVSLPVDATQRHLDLLQDIGAVKSQQLKYRIDFDAVRKAVKGGAS